MTAPSLTLTRTSAMDPTGYDPPGAGGDPPPAPILHPPPGTANNGNYHHNGTAAGPGMAVSMSKSESLSPPVTNNMVVDFDEVDGAGQGLCGTTGEWTNPFSSRGLSGSGSQRGGTATATTPQSSEAFSPDAVELTRSPPGDYYPAQSGSSEMSANDVPYHELDFDYGGAGGSSSAGGRQTAGGTGRDRECDGGGSTRRFFSRGCGDFSPTNGSESVAGAGHGGGAQDPPGRTLATSPRSSLNSFRSSPSHSVVGGGGTGTTSARSSPNSSSRELDVALTATRKYARELDDAILRSADDFAGLDVDASLEDEYDDKEDDEEGQQPATATTETSRSSQQSAGQSSQSCGITVTTPTASGLVPIQTTDLPPTTAAAATAAANAAVRGRFKGRKFRNTTTAGGVAASEVSPSVRQTSSSDAAHGPMSDSGVEYGDTLAAETARRSLALSAARALGRERQFVLQETRERRSNLTHAERDNENDDDDEGKNSDVADRLERQRRQIDRNRELQEHLSSQEREIRKEMELLTEELRGNNGKDGAQVAKEFESEFLKFAAAANPSPSGGESRSVITVDEDTGSLLEVKSSSSSPGKTSLRERLQRRILRQQKKSRQSRQQAGVNKASQRHGGRRRFGGGGGTSSASNESDYENNANNQSHLSLEDPEGISASPPHTPRELRAAALTYLSSADNSDILDGYGNNEDGMFGDNAEALLESVFFPEQVDRVGGGVTKNSNGADREQQHQKQEEERPGGTAPDPENEKARDGVVDGYERARSFLAARKNAKQQGHSSPSSPGTSPRHHHPNDGTMAISVATDRLLKDNHKDSHTPNSRNKNRTRSRHSRKDAQGAGGGDVPTDEDSLGGDGRGGVALKHRRAWRRGGPSHQKARQHHSARELRGGNNRHRHPRDAESGHLSPKLDDCHIEDTEDDDTDNNMDDAELYYYAAANNAALLRLTRQVRYGRRGELPAGQGSRVNRIRIHVYDLIASETMMQLPWGCDFPIGKCFNVVNSGLHALGTGAYHCGVEVNNIEYAFGANNVHGMSGVFTCVPKQSPGYEYRTTLDFGERRTMRRSWISVPKVDCFGLDSSPRNRRSKQHKPPNRGESMPVMATPATPRMQERDHPDWEGDNNPAGPHDEVEADHEPPSPARMGLLHRDEERIGPDSPPPDAPENTPEVTVTSRRTRSHRRGKSTQSMFVTSTTTAAPASPAATASGEKDKSHSTAGVKNHHRRKSTSFYNIPSVYREVETFVDGRTIMEQMAREYMGCDYDLLRKNCCTFARDACLRLGVREEEIPTWFLNIAEAGAATEEAVQNVENSVLSPIKRMLSTVADGEDTAKLLKDGDEPGTTRTGGETDRPQGFEVVAKRKRGSAHKTEMEIVKVVEAIVGQGKEQHGGGGSSSKSRRSQTRGPVGGQQPDEDELAIGIRHTLSWTY